MMSEGKTHAFYRHCSPPVCEDPSNVLEVFSTLSSPRTQLLQYPFRSNITPELDESQPHVKHLETRIGQAE